MLKSKKSSYYFYFLIFYNLIFLTFQFLNEQIFFLRIEKNSPNYFDKLVDEITQKMSDECQSKWQCMIDAGFNSFIGSSKETKIANFKDWDIDCFIHYYIDGMSIRLNKRTWSDFFFWMRWKSQGNCEFGHFRTNFLIATYFVICMCFPQ